MKACVKLVASRVGVGVQTVTGIVDRDGLPFTGKVVLNLNLGVALNTLGYQSGANITAVAYNHGIDNAVDGVGASVGDIDQFVAKIVSTGDLRRYSFGDYQPDIFFGGNWQGYGYVSAFRSGELDITWALNNRGGFGMMLVVLGGDDLVLNYSAGVLSGTIATSGAPVAVLNLASSYVMGSAALATTGAGGRQMTWGWDTKFYGRATAAALMLNQAGNSRGLLSDRMFTTISGAAFSGAPRVSAWGGASYTIADGYAAGSNTVAFSGVRAYQTVFNLNTATGLQVVPIPIAAKWVKLVTVGAVASALVDTTQAQLCVGWTDGVRQGAGWYGEDMSGNPIDGARYLSDARILQIPTQPDANTTAFTTIVSVSSLNPESGDLTLNITASAGVAYQVALFAIGDDLPTPATSTYVIRRLRRFPLPFNTSYWAFVSRLELLMQTGDAPLAGQGSDPLVTLRCSPDGGRTWGNLIEVSCGTRGDYEFRPTINQLGRFRNGLVEVSATDPLLWYWLNAFIDVEFGGA